MRKKIAIIMLCMLTLAAGRTGAQFDSGSNGSYGQLITVAGNNNIVLPPDGIIHATTVTVTQGSTLTFTRNALNTPVYILATNEIRIFGDIMVRGENATGFASGRGGPGGYDGGAPGAVGGIAPGAGLGPGGGLPGSHTGDSTHAGSGSYAVKAVTDLPGNGKTYGSPLLIPLVGGSGGGGTSNVGGAFTGGGGGGGALLLAASRKIVFPPQSNATGRIFAEGGAGSGLNGGSGGAVRLIAPIIEGAPQIAATGNNSGVWGGNGRIRIDTLDQRNMTTVFLVPSATLSIGSFMKVFLDNPPRLDITAAAGTSIPPGSNPVFVNLPQGSQTTQNVTVRAEHFTGVIPIEVVVTPENGTPVTYETTIDMSTNPNSRTIQVTIPVNTTTFIQAFKR